MSKTASRRGFIGSSLATVAVTPCALASAETTPAATQEAPDAIKAAVEKAVTECREAAFDQRMEADAAYGKALVARFGPGVVDTIRELTIARAKGWLEAAKLEKRDLEAVKTQLWSNIGPRFDVRVVADAKTHLQYEVRKCPYADAMRRYGAAELGFAYSCAFDIGFCQGLNPAIRFTRTKTLMMGDPICDHTYDLAADGAAASASGAAAAVSGTKK